MASFKFSIRSLMIACAVIAVLLAVVQLYKRFDLSIRDSYRVSIAGAILVHYLRDTGGWPRNWEDLRNYAQSNPGKFGNRGDLSDLSNQIDINFAFNPNSHDFSPAWSRDTPPLIVVRTKDGRYNGAVGNPNEAIYLYLQQIASQSMYGSDTK